MLHDAFIGFYWPRLASIGCMCAVLLPPCCPPGALHEKLCACLSINYQRFVCTLLPPWCGLVAVLLPYWCSFVAVLLPPRCGPAALAEPFCCGLVAPSLPSWFGIVALQGHDDRNKTAA